MAHIRSGPLKAYHILGQITAQIRFGPLRGFGLNYGPLLGPERGRPLMDRIKYGPEFGPKHGSQLMGWPTSVLKILWAYS